MLGQFGRVHADIDLDAFSHNFTEICRCAGNTPVAAVIKTDGYGHGAEVLSGLLEEEEQCWGYAVATAHEAFSLRGAGRKKPILILGYTFPEEYEEMIRQEIRFTVFTTEMAENIAAAAERVGRPALVHIKLDTGMGRIGFQITPEDADCIEEICRMQNIRVEGIFTHFAKADETDKTYTRQQEANFTRMTELLAERGISIPVQHVSNSAAIVEMPEFRKDLVRAGIILYGLWPSDEVDHDRIRLEPVMSIRSTIVHVKTLPAGSSISYGGTFVTQRESRIATIPVGYGDGYPRQLSNKGWVLIRGKRAPITGRVCMDQFMVDVTDIPEAVPGDEVILLGKSGSEEITMDDLGALSGRFNYEFACDIGKRVPRNYYQNGELIARLDCV